MVGWSTRSATISIFLARNRPTGKSRSSPVAARRSTRSRTPGGCSGSRPPRAGAVSTACCRGTGSPDVSSPGDVSPGKPHPAVLQRALAEAGVGAADAVMIGDTSYDMVMACQAGVRPIGVAWGYHDEDGLRAAGAESVVADFAALLRLLGEEIAP
jgi:beta-phosphoglucomutase-like phosphatase (HAD superfamily)